MQSAETCQRLLTSCNWQATREPMLKFIALALEANQEHTKEMPDVSLAAPRGMMLNLSAVLLKVCEPFLDPATGKAWGKLDSRSACFASIARFSDCKNILRQMQAFPHVNRILLWGCFRTVRKARM